MGVRWMPDIERITVADLTFDEQNPRLSIPNEGQRSALRAMATVQGPKLRALVEDIVTYGLDPSELPIVARVEGENRFVVLDGNRRLTAIRALENPDSIADAVPATVLNAIRGLSRQYQGAPIESVECVVVKDRDEADHWIELRHTGERGGAGPVQWGSDESSRFRARRSNASEIHTQALDFLQARGDITPEFRSTVPASTFRRLLGTPAVRSKLGIGWSGGKLTVLAPEGAVAKALLHVAKDIAIGTGGIKVGDVYTREQRLEYANGLPQGVVATPASKAGQGAPAGTDTRTPAGRPPTRTPPPPPRPRERLIPRDCVLNVTEPRVRQIEAELRGLSLDTYPNATSVLFRVFIELSADAYVQRVGLKTSVDARLGTKLLDVTHDLMARAKLTRQQAAPVRKAAESDSFLGPSITVMNHWVHNQHMFPAASDLRTGWDNLQPWFGAVWST
jgi:hypothetical protein